MKLKILVVTLCAYASLLMGAPSGPSLQPIQAQYKKEFKQYGLSEKAFHKIGFFLENQLQDYVTKYKTNYLPPSKTGLPLAVEYDPDFKTKFIIFEGKKAYLGEGKKKVVTKAVLYQNDPEIVARGEQSQNMVQELKMTKLLHNAEGLFVTYGFGSHGKYTTIYSKLYRSGSLRDLYDHKVKLSTLEKMKIANGILKGINSMHSDGLVHRDLGSRNYFTDIPKGKPGNRDVVAVIADLGRTAYAKNVAQKAIQGNTTYIAPEGLFIKKMKGSDYFATDMYAIGCVLYQLFYGKQAVWQDHSYVKDDFRPLKIRYIDLVSRINSVTLAKKQALLVKEKAGHNSPAKSFELLVLQLVSPDPADRPTSEEASDRMNAIVEKALE